MKRIRTILVEDNRLLREGLTAMLKSQSDITVLEAVSSGEAFLKRRHRTVDVVLLDLFLGSHTSLGLVKAIKESNPDTRIIVMDLAPVQPTLMEYVRAGVAGFVLKDATFTEFLHTVREVARGAKVLPASMTSTLLTQIADHATKGKRGNPFKSVKMTSREREVVELIAEGLSNKQIAERLNLAVETVKSHVHNILEKLALHARLEIATYRHVTGHSDDET